MKMNLTLLVSVGLLALSALGFSQTQTPATSTTKTAVTAQAKSAAQGVTAVNAGTQQVKEQSIAVSTSTTGFSLTYLFDHNSGLVGITDTVKPLLPRLTADALVVTPTSRNTSVNTNELWAGAALKYDLLGKPTNGWSAYLLGGYKGYDLTAPFSSQTLNGKNFVLGFSVGYKF